MDKTEFINRRRGRYLAQILSDFENSIVPIIPDGNEQAVEAFKSMVRNKLNAMANDVTEVIELDGEISEVGQALRDSLYPGISPRRVTTTS